jgi:hypothetical protein
MKYWKERQMGLIKAVDNEDMYFVQDGNYGELLLSFDASCANCNSG